MKTENLKNNLQKYTKEQIISLFCQLYEEFEAYKEKANVTRLSESQIEDVVSFFGKDFKGGELK